MAQPTGSITPAVLNDGYDIKDAWTTINGTDYAIPVYQYIVCRIDLMPFAWAPNNRSDIYQKYSISRVATSPTGGGLTEYWTIAKEVPDENSVFVNVGSYSSGPLWSEDLETEALNGSMYRDLPGYGSVEENPKYMVIEICMEKIPEEFPYIPTTMGVKAVYINAVNEKEFNGDDCVIFESNDTDKRIYDDFDCVSSAFAKYGIQNNFNKLVYESRQSFMTILFGTAENVD